MTSCHLIKPFLLILTPFGSWASSRDKSQFLCLFGNRRLSNLVNGNVYFKPSLGHLSYDRIISFNLFGFIVLSTSSPLWSITLPDNGQSNAAIPTGCSHLPVSTGNHLHCKYRKYRHRYKAHSLEVSTLIPLLQNLIGSALNVEEVFSADYHGISI